MTRNVALSLVFGTTLFVLPALAQDGVPKVIEKPGGDRNVTNFDYIPPDQPRRKYAIPDPNALPSDIEFETLQDRVLRLEEIVEQQQSELIELRKRLTPPTESQ